MDDLEIAAVRKLLDRQAIWDCMLSYTRGMDRMDTESVRSAYHEDAWDDHGAVVLPGHELADFGVEYHRVRHRYSQHFLTNHKCEIEGDIAHAETYFFFFGSMLDKEKPAELLGGRYIDRLDRRDGEWKIADRLCLIEWTTTNVAEGPPREDERASRSRDDASYMRPAKMRKERLTFPLG